MSKMTFLWGQVNFLCAAIGLLVLTVNVNPLRAQVTIIEEPRDTEAVLGMQVLLKCRLQTLGPNFTFADVDVFWQVTPDISFISPFYLGPNENLNEEVFPQYSFAGNQMLGEFDLEITEILDTHFGTYSCVAVNVLDKTIVAQSSAASLVHLTPLPPSEFNCSSFEEDLSDLAEDFQFQAACYSKGGLPAPSLEWTTTRTLSGATLVVDYSSHLNIEARDSNATNVLTLRLSAADHSSTLICKMLHSEGEEQCSIGPLEVKYSPQITIDPSPDLLNPGGDLRLACEADANPSEVEFQWIFDGQMLYDDNSSAHLFLHEENGAVLVVLNATEEYEGVEVSCQATNSLGSKTSSFTIRLHQLQDDEDEGVLDTNLYIIIGVASGLVLLLLIFALINVFRNAGYCFIDTSSNRSQNYMVEGAAGPIQGYDLKDFEGGAHDNRGLTSDSGELNRTNSPNDSSISQENNEIVQINSL